MIIKLIKKNSGNDLIQNLIKKYNTKERLEQKYKLTNDPLLYLDIEDWNYFEQHPDEIQTTAKVLLLKDLELDKTDFNILSLLKKEGQTLDTLSKQLMEDIDIIQPHLKKLEQEGFIQNTNTESFIPKLQYDEISIEI